MSSLVFLGLLVVFCKSVKPELGYTYQDHKRYLDAFVVGIAFMESVIPPAFPRSEPMGGLLWRSRTDEGEEFILEQNQFVSGISSKRTNRK